MRSGARPLQADPEELPHRRRQIEGGHCAPNTPQGQGIAPAECGVVLAAPPAFPPMVKRPLTRSPYIQMRRAAYSAPFVILVPCPSQPRMGRYRSRTAQLRARLRCDDDDADDSAERRRHSQPEASEHPHL
jgi:hypothetical protein